MLYSGVILQMALVQGYLHLIESYSLIIVLFIIIKLAEERRFTLKSVLRPLILQQSQIVNFIQIMVGNMEVR
jgi:hypothetical protein